MIEPIMYLTIGFLISTLLSLMIFPLVHNRAVRLTARRLEAATPLSMAEIQAEKDQLRAEFALTVRRLEMSIDQLKNKTVSQLAELGKKTDAINRLKVELGDKSVAVFALEAREQAIARQFHAAEAELAAISGKLHQTGQTLVDKQRELAELTRALSESSTIAERRGAELAAINAHTTALAAEIETLGGRLAELENRLTNQTRLLAAREQENDLLQQQVKAARLRHAESEPSAGNETVSSDLDTLRAEKAALEGHLRIARNDRAILQRELDTARRKTEGARATERIENAQLRERINEFAAEVAKLATTIEGPNSPIDAILAAEPAPAPAKGTASLGAMAGDTLADRIRALQSRAKRARQEA